MVDRHVPPNQPREPGEIGSVTPEEEQREDRNDQDQRQSRAVHEDVEAEYVHNDRAEQGESERDEAAHQED